MMSFDKAIALANEHNELAYSSKDKKTTTPIASKVMQVMEEVFSAEINLKYYKNKTRLNKNAASTINVASTTTVASTISALLSILVDVLIIIFLTVAIAFIIYRIRINLLSQKSAKKKDLNMSRATNCNSVRITVLSFTICS